ncbi:MAG: histidinol-phosphatase [Bacteroidales bacterium]|nr:histidinol-phosphatase [Bacteroidales bacterium]MBN2756646.1 histidinol-phosphatase [Bacteroidales bacterium]
MKWTNYHSHTSFSDGKGEAELYAISAIEHKMYAYGYSCHSPVPFYSGWNMKFENLLAYINEIKRLKIKYQDKIKIFLGMEIDYIKNIIGINNFKHLNLDYTIGGVHFLGFFDDGSAWDYDGGKIKYEKGLKELFNNDIKSLVKYYYEQVNNMIIDEKPDIVAHLDLIKKYNKGNFFFDENEKWYKDLVFETLNIISKSDSILEVNTRGVLKGLNEEFYPSNFVLDKCKELNIKMCINADTHNPTDVMALLPEVRNLLIDKGFKEFYIFDEKGWEPIGIEN